MCQPGRDSCFLGVQNGVGVRDLLEWIVIRSTAVAACAVLMHPRNAEMGRGEEDAVTNGGGRSSSSEAAGLARMQPACDVPDVG